MIKVQEDEDANIVPSCGDDMRVVSKFHMSCVTCQTALGKACPSRVGLSTSGPALHVR